LTRYHLLCYNIPREQILMMVKPLSELEPQERGRIVKVGGGGEIRRRLLDMGMIAGAMVEVKRVAPLGDPIEIRVRGYDLALRKNEATDIQVELTEGTLVMASPSETVTILAIRAGWGLQRRLAGLGLTPGAKVRVASNSKRGPVIVEVAGSRLLLGYGVARRIMVSAGESQDK
jgi:Fe2+ transport system protein FeoA